MWLLDTLTNLVSGLGTSRDPTTMSHYHFREMNREQLEAAYRSNWVARRVVDAIAEDCTREWREWQAEQQQIEDIEAVEKKFKLQLKTRQAITKARLYGGAAILMGIDGSGEPDEPLDLDVLDADCLRFAVVLNRYELNAGPRIYDAESEWYTRPEYYTIATPMSNVLEREAQKNNDKYLSPYLSGMVHVHPSRVVEFVGNELPDWRLAPLGGGWGDSVIQTIDETLKDFGLTMGGIANMVNDAKIDVIKIPALADKLSTDAKTKLLFNRFQTAAVGKSTLNALLIDEKEEWQRTQTSFGSLPEILQQFMTLVSAGAGIPVSRLMGSSPGKGLSTTGGGESDLRNYYDDCTSKQKTVYSPAMSTLDSVVQISALGEIDPNVYYDWAPLYLPEPKEVAEIAFSKAQATNLDVQMGLINEDALRKARVNQLIEDGTYPGLDDAIDEFGAEPPEPTPEDMVNHLTMMGKTLPPHLGGPPAPAQLTGPNTNDRRLLDYSPDQPRAASAPGHSGGEFASTDGGDYGLVAGDVKKFHELKDEWAKINNHLLNFVDMPPNSPEAQADIDKLEKISKEISTLRADPGTPEGIGLPGGPRDVTIVGAGPGGLAAGIFGGAEGLDTLIVESNVVAGGQARYSSRIENFPGFPIGVSGETLTKSMFEQSKRLGADQKLGVRVMSMVYNERTGMKHLVLSTGEQIDSRTVILAGGVEFRRPTIPGADGAGVFVGDGKALTAYSAGNEATVTGGSNGAAQAALGAAVKAKHVYLISRSPITKGMSDYQVSAVRNNPKITVIENDSITKINRDAKGAVTSLETKNGKTLPSNAVGVFLGSVPETDWLSGKVNRDQSGRVSTNTRLETNIPGVFAVGDMREGAIGRVGVAVGEGQLALREAHVYLESLKSKPTATADSYVSDAKDSTKDLISQLFDLDRANPFLGSTIEGVKPGRKRRIT